MIRLAENEFRGIVEAVAQQLVTIEHDPDGSFIKTPILYPSGAGVVVKIADERGRFFVSDMGLGFEEADMMGAAPIFVRHAQSVAERAGIQFDQHAFFTMHVSREQLSAAIVIVANCSQEAVALTAYKVAERKAEEDIERLYEKLVRVFDKRHVTKNAPIVGESDTTWHVAAMVRLERKRAAFEFVTKHPISVASAHTKFSDIAALGAKAPTRVAVVHKRREFGTYLTVLQRSANVIEDTAPDVSVKHLLAA
jgi:hypothetical protein